MLNHGDHKKVDFSLFLVHFHPGSSYVTFINQHVIHYIYSRHHDCRQQLFTVGGWWSRLHDIVRVSCDVYMTSSAVVCGW